MRNVTIDNGDYILKTTLRAHLVRNRPERPAMVKPGNWTQPDDPTWEAHGSKARTRYSKNPKLCKHQFANGRQFCPYCGLTNPRM